MDPYVKWYADRLDGLRAQIAELIGLAQKVPPLIQADRERRWAEVGSRPSGGSEEQVDVYGREAGASEGWGFARFDRAVYSASLVLGWEAFHGFLAEELLEAVDRIIGPRNPIVNDLVDEMQRELNRFDRLAKRFKDWLGVDLRTTWLALDEIRLTRNAIVHNAGVYTDEYVRNPLARFPQDQGPTAQTPAGLVNSEQIPLDETYVVTQLMTLTEVAEKLRQTVENLHT